jgi:DNA-binding NtrC family response regulator
LTHRAQIALSLHSWPGNVRELENVIGHACMMTLGDTIDVQDLPPYLHQGGVQGSPAEPVHAASRYHSAGAESASAAASAPGPVSSLEDQERLLIVRALQAASGNQSEAARILRIGRDALRYKLKKHGL